MRVEGRLELLCGANCEGDTRVWCSKYDDDAAACGNAYAQRVNGSYGRCEHSGDACTLEHIYECPSPPPSPLPPWAPDAAPLPSACANPCGLTLDEDEAADEAPVSKGSSALRGMRSAAAAARRAAAKLPRAPRRLQLLARASPPPGCDCAGCCNRAPPTPPSPPSLPSPRVAAARRLRLRGCHPRHPHRLRRARRRRRSRRRHRRNAIADPDAASTRAAAAHTPPPQRRAAVATSYPPPPTPTPPMPPPPAPPSPTPRAWRGRRPRRRRRRRRPRLPPQPPLVAIRCRRRSRTVRPWPKGLERLCGKPCDAGLVRQVRRRRHRLRRRVRAARQRHLRLVRVQRGAVSERHVVGMCTLVSAGRCPEPSPSPTNDSRDVPT